MLHKWRQIWEERVQWKLMADCTAVVSAVVANLIEEDEKKEEYEEEEDIEEGSFTKNLAPR